MWLRFILILSETQEEARKAERRNRDEFRKLMDDHIAAGVLGVKTHWRDYCMKVSNLIL